MSPHGDKSTVTSAGWCVGQARRAARVGGLIFHAPSKISRTKNQPKEEVFGTEIPRTSKGHSRGHPGPKLRSGHSKCLEKQALGRGHPWPEGADVHTLKGLPKTSVSKTLGWFFIPHLKEASPNDSTSLNQSPLKLSFLAKSLSHCAPLVAPLRLSPIGTASTKHPRPPRFRWADCPFPKVTSAKRAIKLHNSFLCYHWGQNYYIPFFMFWGIIFGNNFYRKLYSM